MSYKTNFLQSDLLTSDRINERRLKTESEIVDSTSSGKNLITTTVNYTNGVVTSIVKFNKTSGLTLTKTLTYTDGVISQIDEVVT